VADISAARTALANQIQNLTGLPCTPRMPDQINPPQAALLPSQPYAKYGITLGGHLASLGLGADLEDCVHVDSVPVVAERGADGVFRRGRPA